MTLTRSQFVLIGIVAALALGAVVGFGLRGGSGGQSAAPDMGGADDAALVQREDRANVLSVGVGEDAERGAVGVDYAASAGEPPATNPKLQGLLDRKIIQSTSVDIEVEEVGRNFQEIIRIAETAGGFVVSSSFSNVDDRQVADLTIRVPGDRYQQVLAQIRGMGEVATESSDANDVTEEYTDLQARLRTLEATERRYLELLAQAEAIPDILMVQDRLDVVRGQIEQVQGRINLLEHLTDLATITIHLRPVAAVAPPTEDGGVHPLEAAATAWERSLDALRGLAAVALVVGAFSWWLVPPLAALGLAGRWWLRGQQRARTEASG